MFEVHKLGECAGGLYFPKKMSETSMTCHAFYSVMSLIIQHSCRNLILIPCFEELWYLLLFMKIIPISVHKVVPQFVSVKLEWNKF